jgi:hypothetical protein
MLKSLGLLGKVKVVVVEKACPRDGEDQPITEEGYQFFKGKISSKRQCNAMIRFCKNVFFRFHEERRSI